MEEHSRRSVETESSEIERLRRLIVGYETRMEEIAKLTSRVHQEIDNSLTTMFGQMQLFLRENLNATAHQRVAAIEVLAARTRDSAALLCEVTQRCNGKVADDATAAGRTREGCFAGLSVD